MAALAKLTARDCCHARTSSALASRLSLHTRAYARKPRVAARRGTTIRAAVQRDGDGRLLDDDGWVIGFSEGAQGAVDEETARRATAFQQNAATSAFKNKAQYLRPDAQSAAAIAQVQDNHYEFLGLAPDCDYKEIRTNYKSLSKQYHPDTTKLDGGEANRLFLRLQSTYETLSEPEKRQFYDWRLTLEVAQGSTMGTLGSSVKGYVVSDNRSRTKANSGVYVAPIDRMAPGENMALSNQAQFALAFDMLAFGLVFVVIGLALLLPPAEIPEMVMIP